jgi:hypothetical protein
MTNMATISIVALFAWLIFALSALASFRLSWGKMARMALVWMAIFTGGFLIATLFL